MLLKKETMYSYDAFQARDRRDMSECDSAVYSSLRGIQGCHLVFFDFFYTKNAPKYQNLYLATQMEHDQSSYFCRGPDDFCWGPAPVGPTLVAGPGRPGRQGGSNALVRDNLERRSGTVWTFESRYIM